MKPGLKIPPILLEGDEAPPPAASGPGHKFELGEKPAPKAQGLEELPSGYGTGRLLLLAREPHGLYAHWDPSPESLESHNALSPAPELSVRVYRAGGELNREVPLVPGTHHSFIGVSDAGQSYFAEIGYYGPDAQWRMLAKSEPVTTPPDTIAPVTEPSFLTIRFPVPEVTPAKPPEPQPAAPVARTEAPRPTAPAPPAPRPPKPAMPPHDLAPATVMHAATAMEPAPAGPVGATPESARIEPDTVDAGFAFQPASASAGPAISWAPELAFSSLEAAGLQWPQAGVSSPIGGAPQPRRGFWFQVNAELVIYGATEPDAQVTCAGQPVALRPDGTFSFRLAFPDGVHELSLTAQSSSGETRQAHLSFVRSSESTG